MCTRVNLTSKSFSHDFMKCVSTNCSLIFGEPYCWSPRRMDLMRKAMFSPSCRMVCIPSSSRVTSAGSVPWAILQYCEGTTGMFVFKKYLFNTSIVAVAPPPVRCLPTPPPSWSNRYAGWNRTVCRAKTIAYRWAMRNKRVNR